MNFAMILMLVAVGFGVSFIVLDASRVAAGHRWPSGHAMMAGKFRPFPVFLALFAGPALFVRAILRAHACRTLSLADAALAVVIAAGWALCYGVVVAECARVLAAAVS